MARHHQRHRTNGQPGPLAHQLAALDGEQVDLGGADEAGNEKVGWPAVQIQRRADLLDAPLSQHHDLVGQRHGLGLVVRDVNRRGLERALGACDLQAQTHAQF